VVFINYSTKEISVKIVYYGPGLSGKTTNLQYIYKKTDKSFRGELVSLDTDTERTLFFDLLPMEVGKIRGFTTKIQLYTVPGQVHYNTTRKLVLKGVDGIVFVVDSQAPILEANIQNYKNMLENLEFNNILIDKIPLVFQYNKRDLNNILPVGELNTLLNPSNKTFFEAVAVKGKGVLETLREITRLTLHSVKEEVFGDFLQEAQEAAENIDRKNKERKKIEKKEIEITPETKEKTEIESEQEIEEETETEEIEVIDEEMEEEPSEKKTIIDIEQKTNKEETETEPKEIKEEKEIEISMEAEEIKEEKPIKDKQEKEPFIESEKKLIEKNLSLKIPSEKIIDSSHIYIQFTNQEGDLIKKWKISKNKIINGATLSLKVNIDIK
jgi:small GTP-binding protein